MKKTKKGIAFFLACTLMCTSLGAGQSVVLAAEESCMEEGTTYTEDEVVAYFEELEKGVEEEMDEKSITDSVLEKCATFILFLSDEKEIKGYTWSTLSEEAKEKVVEVYLQMDTKLEEKYPNYLNKVKVYGKKAKSFITDTYVDLKEKTSEKIDEYIKAEKQEEISSKVQEGMDTLENSFSKAKEKAKSWARGKLR